jgi:hypothetical protein
MYLFTTEGFGMPTTYKHKTDRRHRSTKPQTLPPKFQAGFLSTLDGRTDLCKALRANYDAIVSDLGGRDDISHVKASLIERFCWLEAVLQTLEHEMANGLISKTEAISRWIQAVNALSGLAKALGIERKAPTAKWAELIPTSDDKNGELADK